MRRRKSKEKDKKVKSVALLHSAKDYSLDSSASEAPEVFPLPESSFLLRLDAAAAAAEEVADTDASDSVDNGGGIGGG